MADDIQSNIKINVDTASAMDSIRLLQNQISAFHTQMSKMGAATSADARNLQQNLVNSINSTGAFTANMTKVRTTAEQFSLSLERNKLSMGEYFRYAGGASKTFGRVFKTEFETINKVARERVKDLQSQYIKLGRDANGAMQAIRVRPLVLDMNNLATKTQIAAQRQQLLNQLLKQGSTNLLNFGKNTQWAGRQLMVGFTIPLSIMGAAAMKAYKEIEEASIRLKRVYGDFGTTNVETEKMVKDIQKLALEYTKYGVAVKDSMDMAADAAAMGKKGADLLAQVASSARLAVLGGVDQQMALKTTTSLTDAFGVSTKQLAKDIDFLNAVENQTVLSIEDMTIAIPKAAPVIQQLGGDVKDLAFFLTAMKEGGINASESANALKSGLASLINPTNTASKMLQGFGINLREIVQGNKGDVKKTVVDFAQALDKLDPLNRAKAIEQLFGKFQFARLSTLFKNVIEEGSQASQVLNLASSSSLELSMLAQRELNKIEASPLFKFQKSIADFQAQLAPVGEQFMKAVTPIISFGADVLKNFNNLGEGVKGFIVKVVAVAGVIGPVLLMSFGLIANAVANVIKGFALVKDIFNKTGKSSLSLGEQVNYMTNEQIQAAAIASSLDQVHSKLKQTFTSEAAAVDALTAAYQRSIAAQRGFAVPITPRGPVAPGPVKRYAAGGIIRGPGTGTSDSILAMVSNGEAIIPAKSVARNPGMVKQLVSGNIPGYRQGKEGDVPTYGEYGLRLQNAKENMKKQSSPASGSEILSFASMRIGEALGIKPSQASVNKGLFDPIYKKYEQTFTRYADKIKLEFDTTFSDISDTNERMRQARQTAAKFIEKEAMQLSTSDAERLALRRSLGLEEDFYGSAPTMPRREGGRFLERARKSIYDLKTTGIRGYVSLSGGAKSLYSRMTGQSAENYQLGHYNEPRYVSGQELAKSPNLSGAARKALESVGITIGKQAEQSVVAGVKKSTRQRSPSKEAFDAGGNIGKGAIQGLQSQIDDAKNAGTQVGQAAAQGVSQSGRAPGRGGRRSSSDGALVFVPGQGYVSEGQLARDAALANAPVQGARQGTKAERLGFTTAGPRGRASNLLNNVGNRVSSGISGMSQGKFQGGMFGASMIAGLGSMIGGPVGDVSGALSMPLAIAGMFPKIQGALGGIVGGLVRFIPVIGTALAAWQLWDQVAVPLIRKNADAYDAITETLSLTQTKIEGLNKFFGTDVKLTGIRAMQIASGSQSENQASIAKQLQETQEFKDIYQKSAQKMQGLSDKDFKSAMEFMAVDLFGQGYEAEAVTAIVDAIALEAKKSRVSIAPELFSLDNAETRALMEKNIQKVFSDVSEISKRNANVGVMSPEDSSRIKASQSQMASYMSSLSGQFASGAITGQQFNAQYERLLSLSEKSFGASGINNLRMAFIQLNAEIGNTMEKLNSVQFGIVSKAINAGVTPTVESGKVFEFGTESQIKAQVKLYDDAFQQQMELNSRVEKTKTQLKSVQSSTQNISNLEGKINEKYDKRIKQLEKIKKLNDQMKESQQGQLSLAEALNKGDIGAAARAAIDIQNNDIQTSLSNQQEGLDAARKAEIEPLKGAQANNTAAVNSLTKKIEDLIAKGITVKNLSQRELDSVMTPTERLKAQGYPEWLIPLLRLINPNAGRALPNSGGGGGMANGGHIKGPGSGTSDSIPAMLSNGEYVIRANAVKTIGVDTLDKLNQADKMGFAAGGMVRAYRKGGMAGCPCGTPGCPGCAKGYAMGGMVKKYKDGGEAKPPKKPRFGLDDIARGLSNPVIQGGAHGTDVLGGMDLAKSYGNIFSGKGDFFDFFSGILAPFALTGLGAVGSAGRSAGLLGRGKDAIKTKIATMNAKKVLGIMGGKEASKLSPQVGFKMTRAGMEQFVAQGKYKTIHDNVRSAAGDSISERLAIEAATGMNKALKLKPGQSPAYGFLGTKEAVPFYHGSIYGGSMGQSAGQYGVDIFNKMINPYSRPLQSYGSTVAFLKPSALKNATVSFGDSLSIYQQAVKAGAKTPQVMKLGSLLTTLRLSSMAKKTKGILGKEFRMPYAEIHTKSGFGLDDVSGIGVSNEFKDRVPEAIASMEALLAQAGRSNIPVHDIIGRGKNAFEKIGMNISKPMPKNSTNPNTLLPLSGPMQGVSLPFGFSKAPTKAEMDAVVAFIQNSPLAQIQRGDALASIVGKSTIAKGTSMFRVPTIRQNQELATKNVGDIIDLGKRFTSIAGQSELQAIGMTAAGKLNTGNRELPVNTIIKFVAGENIPGILNHKAYNQNYLKSAFGKKADEYPFQSEGLLPPGLKGKIVGISQSGDQRILEVLLSKFSKGGMVRKYANGGLVSTRMPMAESIPKQFANGGLAMGTDTVPAMLTPGEFVIKKSAVDRIGTSTLTKINGYANGGIVGGSTSTAIGDSVYNYSVNVNVATDSDPNQIARAVMSQIRKVDNHRVRGSGI